MKCKICENYFVSETKFNNLFKFEEICPKCKLIYNQSPKINIFPIDDGLVEYVYLYDNLMANYKQKEYLSKNCKHLYKEIIGKEKEKVVIIIDDVIYEELKTELIYILGFKQLFFMSLFRYKFDVFVNFY